MTNLTFTTQNKFSFVCPIFNTETKLSSCISLRELFVRGEPVEKRKGCQACMRSNKCPATRIMHNIIYINNNESSHFSNVEKVGKLTKPILESTLPVMIQENHLVQFSVPVQEIALMSSANERILKQLQSAPGESSGRANLSLFAAKNPKVAKTKNTVVEKKSAAETGDMAAAINA